MSGLVAMSHEIDSMRRFAVLAAASFCALSALAVGKWLEAVPTGGVEIDETAGEGRAALEERLDAIERDCSGKPTIALRAKSLAAVFDHVRLAVNTNDLFVHWHPDSLVLSTRSFRRIEAFSRAAPERSRADICANGGAFDSRLDMSHVCPDWRSILELGPTGLAERARRRRETAASDDERLFLDCVAEVYDALGRECRRWADFAERRGMADVALTLREIAAHPPRTLREALQWAIVYDRAQEVEGEDVRSQGLFDRLFLPFYRADIAAGRETRESAKKLVADWFARFWSQQHPNGKNIGLGGYGPDGAPVWNELTELGIEVFRESGRINPKLTYRFGAKTPRSQLEKVTACLAEGKTSIVFSNDDLMYRMFRKFGKDEGDLCDYVLVGCYEPGIGGREIVASMACDVNLVKPLEAVFNCGRDFAGRRIGPDCPLPADGDAFESEYMRQLGSVISNAVAATRAVERRWYDLHPAPLFSGAFRDCIESARDYSRGGCRYNSSGFDCIGLATVADSLAAVRYIVDEKRLATMRELADAMRKNWAGSESLRLAAMRSAPKWGNNDDRADEAAKRVYDAVCDQVNAERNGHGGMYQAGFWSIQRDMMFAPFTGPTPDGRRRGDTVSRNNSATAGCGREGATALMLSNLKLDMTSCPDGHIVDLVLPLSLAKGGAGAANIAAVLRAYFAKGGQCVHLNCLDARILRDAMKHPERYADLQIRVCGWNVLWNDLTAVEKRHFLATAEAQEGGMAE